MDRRDTRRVGEQLEGDTKRFRKSESHGDVIPETKRQPGTKKKKGKG